MNGLQDIDGLSECIGRAIQYHLAKSNLHIAWPQIDGLDHPVLRVEAFLEDASPAMAKKRKKKPERVTLVCRLFLSLSQTLEEFMLLYAPEPCCSMH
jgi:ATP-dependent RNA helicase DDX49/DBP8